MDGALLEVTDLRTEFVSRGGVVRAVDDVSFTVGTRETLAIVGESGSGKSATALSLLRLIAPPVGRVSGRIRFADVDVLALDAEGLRRLRGRDVAMVFQDPMTSLNPVLTIGLQLTETLSTHLGLGRRAARARATELLDLVGIPDARRRLDDYPHQFSGGMRQRVMIAMALSCAPKLLIADEPMRMSRAALLEVLAKDYVRTGRAKGLHERVVIYRHALRNALIPVVTVVGIQAGALLGGTVVVEQIFSWAGLGSLVVRTIVQRDYPLLHWLILFLTSFYVIVVLMVDIAYMYLDPRLRRRG